MKKAIRILLCGIIAIGLLSSAAAFASDEIRVYLDGGQLEFDTAPQIIDGRTMVPMRAVFEAFGTEVEWLEESQQIVVTGRGLWMYTLQIGSYQIEYFHPQGGVDYGFAPQVIIEGYTELDVPPQIVSGRTLVPLRAVSEVFGADVQWDEVARTVTIISRMSSIASRIAAAWEQASPVSFERALLDAMPAYENFMISPFSLRMALAMAANGASGLSQEEILAALGIDDLGAFNRSAAEFIASANANEDVEFNIANSIWFNEDRFDCDELDFSEQFRRIIATYFAGVAERIRAINGANVINAWIAEQTRDRITDVVDDDTFAEGSETLAVLVNTIYFNGDWARPFLRERTRDDIFTDRNGVESTLPFMEQTGRFSFYESEYFQMLAKPYADRDIRMYFVLPRVDERLPFNMFEEAIAHMTMHDVNFRLPRFRTESFHENLVGILQGMGVSEAFKRKTHFDFWDMFYPTHVGGMALYIWIDDILQKTFIEVDEEGTEAAAATVIVIGAVIESAPPPPIPFHCDRPFLYFIRNDITGDILFMGEFAFAE